MIVMISIFAKEMKLAVDIIHNLLGILIISFYVEQIRIEPQLGIPRADQSRRQEA